MRHLIRPRLAATAVATLAIGAGLPACGAGDRPPSSAGTPSVSASATAAPATTTGPTPAAPGGAGEPGGTGSGSGSGGDGPGQPAQPTGRPPRIMSPSVEPYLSEGELVTEVIGHAFDDDGPDPQLRVARVDIHWGDGAISAAQLDGHGAFRDFHEYDPSYRGRTVTVRIVAYGHAGQTTTETRSVPLPS